MLRTADLRLPADDEWGEMHVTTTAPDAGTRWTDTGADRDRRGLKHRGEGEIRTVPIPPPLVRLFRTHLDEHGASPDGHVFRGVKGGPLATITYRRAWGRARKTAFDAGEYMSPLARRRYDLRHACLSTWLNGGVAPAQVAEWAGHSVEVLLRTYVRCLDGQHDLAKRRIMEALDDLALDDAQFRATQAMVICNRSKMRRARRPDNGPLSLPWVPRGCVAEVFAVLKPGSNSQRLFQLVAVGIGPPAASSRQIATASSIAASASSRRPSSPSRIDRLFSEGQVGPERVRAGRGQLPADAGGFLDRGQRLLPPPQAAQPVDRLFSERGQVGPERVRAGRGQLPADGDGFLDRGQRLLPPPQAAQPDRQVVQRAGQVGPERVRAGRGQLPADRWLPRSRPAPPPAGPGRPAGATGCSASWPGRAGTRPGGPRPAPGGWRRLPRSRPAPPPAAPGSASRSARLFSEPGQVGPERVRAGRGQLPAEVGGFLDRGQRLLPPPQAAQPDRQVVQRRWPGRAGTRPGGPRPAPGGW